MRLRPCCRASLLLLLLARPAAAQEPCPLPDQSPHLLVRLYFGQSIKGAGPISRRAWDRFVAEQVTTAFPDGFTMLDATGQYRERGGSIVREQTEVVEVAAADTPEFRARVAALADTFRRRFNQSAVGLVSQSVCAAF